MTFPELPHRQFKTLQCTEKYTNSNIKRATRIRHRRTNMMDSTIRKIIYNRLEGEILLLLLLNATGNVVLIDCDDKTLVILLEEL